MAYNQQSISLRFVQTYGPELERAVSKALNWPTGQGRVIYFQHEKLNLSYDLQVDAIWPNA
ncbi:MAG TPA: hypothetical protein VF611_04565, partial [Pyrinomonadaceae bacterium]